MTQVRACILSVAGPELSPEEAGFLSESQPWGVILMGRSCIGREQVRRLISGIHDALGRTALVFIDQEGGRVARLKPPDWPRFPPAAAYGALYAADPGAGIEAARLGHRLMAHELAALGIHADCAPVCDLPVEGAHDIIGDRAFARDGAAAAALARAAMEGLHAGGVASVIKHIPGHGRAFADSHEALPRIDAPAGQLERDYMPFAALSDAPMAMTAHILYGALDRVRPATLSPVVIAGVIRGVIGFDGLLMSDDLGMAALTGTLAERAVAASRAGCDMLLHCAGFEREPAVILAEMREVAGAAPRLEGRAAERAARAEAVAAQAPEPLDTQAAWARFGALLGMAGGPAGAAA